MDSESHVDQEAGKQHLSDGPKIGSISPECKTVCAAKNEEDREHVRSGDPRGDVVDGLLLSRHLCSENEEPKGVPEVPKECVNFVPRADGFDMVIVSEHFEKSLESTDEINMEHYIIAYRELERFFDLMGTMFSFVGADIKDKLEILSKHHSSHPHAASYVTIRQMMEFETALPERLEPGRTPENSQLVSGSRTLLRLHRALEFIMLFMDGLIVAKDEQYVSSLAQDAYKVSLAKYHPWLVRKGAHLAMYTLPSKLNLMERISKHSYVEVTGFARRMTGAMKPVYERTQELYTEYKLHELP